MQMKQGADTPTDAELTRQWEIIPTVVDQVFLPSARTIDYAEQCQNAAVWVFLASWTGTNS